MAEVADEVVVIVVAELVARDVAAVVVTVEVDVAVLTLAELLGGAGNVVKARVGWKNAW